MQVGTGRGAGGGAKWLKETKEDVGGEERRIRRAGGGVGGRPEGHHGHPQQVGKAPPGLVELEADKVEVIQLDWWLSEDEEDEEEDEIEEGEEVEVEKELLELAKEREENGDGLEEEE